MVIEMKRTILLLSVLGVAFLSGCGEDSGTPPRITSERGVSSQYVKVQAFGSVVGTVTEETDDSFIVTITVKK